MPFPAAFQKKKSSALDLEAPEPFDKAPAPKKDPMPMAAHESTEQPAEESTENVATKLMTDIDAAGESEGLDSETTRRVAGAIFGAMARCFAGGGESEMEPQAPDQNEERGNRINGEY